MEGWIKISRSISDHWIWQDDRFFKWWVSLILAANYKDRKELVGNSLVVIRRGQMFASLSSLADLWASHDKKGKIIRRPSRLTIISFLRLLEKDAMIHRDFLNHQTTLITICNYERYQLDETTLETTSETGSETTIETTSQESSPLNPLKEDLEERKNIIITPSIHAHARAREEDFFSQLLQSQSFSEGVCMSLHITPEEFSLRLQAFYTEVSAKGITHQSFKDYRRHAFDWIRCNLTKSPSNAQNRSDSPEEARRRRQAEVANLVAAKLRQGGAGL